MVTLGVDTHHQAEACLGKAAAPSINVLHHRRFGHIGEARLQAAMRSMGVDSAGQQLDQCVVCIRAKPVRPAIGGGPTYQVDTPGVHSDLVGPLPETGMGFQYFIMAIDDYCRYAMVGLLRRKSDAVSALKTFLSG